MPNTKEPPQNTFVVRFWWKWQEEGSYQTKGWRGCIKHLQSGEGISFEEFDQMLAFIQRFITFLALPPSEEER